jgi:hypothetical protein
MLMAAVSNSTSRCLGRCTEIRVPALEDLREQERRMAGEIDTHESLQRLRIEHAALMERIREAEERAQPF